MRAKITLLFFSLWLIMGCENSAPLGSAESSIEASEGTVYYREVEEEAPKPPAPAIAKTTVSESNFGTDTFLQTLEKAKMVFNPPHEMIVGKTETMLLVIDLTKTFEELEANFEANEDLSRRDILVSEEIEVKLSGSAFTIKPITPEKQYLSKLETTEWKWNVTPEKIGQHDLNLVITAISPNGKNRVRTFDEIIQVKNLSAEEQVMNFFKSEYKWLFATFFIPFFLWYLKNRKAKKEEKETSNPS